MCVVHTYTVCVSSLLDIEGLFFNFHSMAKESKTKLRIRGCSASSGSGRIGRRLGAPRLPHDYSGMAEIRGNNSDGRNIWLSIQHTHTESAVMQLKSDSPPSKSNESF